MQIVCKIECIAFVVPCIHVLKNAQKTLNLHKQMLMGDGSVYKMLLHSMDTSVHLPRTHLRVKPSGMYLQSQHWRAETGGSPAFCKDLLSQLSFFILVRFIKFKVISLNKYLEYHLWQIACTHLIFNI